MNPTLSRLQVAWKRQQQQGLLWRSWSWPFRRSAKFDYYFVTALETSIDALLKSAKLRDENIHQTEEAMLQINQLSVEEVTHRRGELRKMRKLMFRAEIKARRVSKIKSKTYRRIKKKEKERLGEKINAYDSQDDEETILKKGLDRARERATLGHKHTGKWARQMRNKEGLDADGRKDLEDMLARGEKLRRRIKGIGSDESEDGLEDHDDDDDDGLDVEGGLEKIKQNAFDELHKLDESGRVEGDENRKGKGVFEMKFMKDAMARKMQATNKSMDDFIKEIGDNIGAGDTDDEEQEDELQVLDSSSGILVQRTGGRSTYRPSETTHHLSTAHLPAASDTSSVTLKSTDLLSPPPPSPILNRHSALSAPSAQDSNLNPWLTRASVFVKVAKKTNEVVQKESKALDKSKNKLMKQMRKREEEHEKAKEDEVVEVSLDKVLTLPSAPSGSGPSQPVRTADRNQLAPVVHADEDDSDSNSEVEVQETALTLKGKGKANGMKAFEQRDLIALAFAGDNVVQNFEEAKHREIASDAPREVDTTIPGWGSWGGAGMQKPPPKPQRIKKIAGIDPTTRADFNKKHIIISEKRDKKAGKYLVKDLPYPYTSRAQFERAMENPLGIEWNTRVAFQRGTLPKVVKKPGIIINPLEKLTT